MHTFRLGTSLSCVWILCWPRFVDGLICAYWWYWTFYPLCLWLQLQKPAWRRFTAMAQQPRIMLGVSYHLQQLQQQHQQWQGVQYLWMAIMKMGSSIFKMLGKFVIMLLCTVWYMILFLFSGWLGNWVSELPVRIWCGCTVVSGSFLAGEEGASQARLGPVIPRAHVLVLSPHKHMDFKKMGCLHVFL